MSRGQRVVSQPNSAVWGGEWRNPSGSGGRAPDGRVLKTPLLPPLPPCSGQYVVDAPTESDPDREISSSSGFTGAAHWLWIAGKASGDQTGAMFSLFYGLWKYMFNKDELRVLILGVDKAGKTTLLEKLKSIYLKGEGLPPDRVVPTVGLNIGRIEDANAKLVFWDLGGQAGLRTIWEKYFEETHGIIYVIDAAAASSFEDAKSTLEKVIHHEHLRAAPILIVANKQDLPGVIADEELARFLHLQELEDRPYMFHAVSAYDGRGIKSGIDWLVEQMKGSKRTEVLRARGGVAGQI